MLSVSGAGNQAERTKTYRTDKAIRDVAWRAQVDYAADIDSLLPAARWRRWPAPPWRGSWQPSSGKWDRSFRSPAEIEAFMTNILADTAKSRAPFG